MKHILRLHNAIKKHIKNIQEKAREARNQEIIDTTIIESDIPAKEKDSENKSTIVFEIKGSTVIKTVTLTILTIYFWTLFGELTEILLVLLVAIILSAAISPVVGFLEKYKVPRALSIVMLYVILLGIVFIVLTSLIPLIIKQLTDFANYLIDLIKNVEQEGVKAIPFIDYITLYVDKEQLVTTIQGSLDSIANNIGTFTKEALSTITSVITNIVSWGGYGLTVLVATFFIVLDESGFESFVISLLPDRYKKYFTKQGKAIALKLGAWLRGQIVLSFTIGLIAFIMLSLLGVEYAFTIAIVTAIAEFVPIVGPLISAVPATLLALSQSSTLALMVLISYLILNTIESNIIAPLIMKKSVGLNPLAIIFAMLIGFKLIGPIGIFLAIPVASAIMVIVNNYASKKDK